MAFMYRVGAVKQHQVLYYPASQKVKQDLGTGYTTRPYAYGNELVRDAIRRNPKDVTGWRNPSPYNLLRRDYVMWEGTVHLCPNIVDDSYEYDECFPRRDFIADMPVTMPWPTANMVNRAEVEALQKLKEQNINYAVAIAEARLSMSMIEKSLWSVFDAYRYAKKKAWRQAAKALKVEPPRWKTRADNVAGRWLELQYGWLPLLSDVYAAYNDAREGITRYTPRISVTRTVKQPVPNFRIDMDWGLTADITHTRESVYGVKVRLDYQLNSEALATASKVGLTNPLEVAWELVPFSFVVDWGIPIGNWLSAWDADFGLSFIGGSKTLFSRVQRTGRIHQGMRSRQVYRAHYADLTATLDGFQMARSVYTSPPIPVVYWKNPVSALHALNALALLKALFPTKVKEK